jgi:hypothetical protein
VRHIFTQVPYHPQVDLLDAVLAEPAIKLLDSDEGRRIRMQTYLLALRSCYQHDASLNESHPTSGFRQILATSLVSTALVSITSPRQCVAGTIDETMSLHKPYNKMKYIVMFAKGKLKIANYYYPDR